MEKNPIELFEELYKVKLLTVKVECPNCGATWGIKISDYNKPEDIPAWKFICRECNK